LGRDFLKQMQAQICYKNLTLTFHHAVNVVSKPLRPDWSEDELNGSEIGIGRIKLPPRTQLVVKLPAEAESVMTEGLVEKRTYNQGCIWRDP
jgi:hypothetical protein